MFDVKENVKRDPIRIMVIDCSAVIREDLISAFSQDFETKIIVTASNSDIALNLLKPNMIELIILIIEFPEMEGLNSLDSLLSINPDLRIIITSTIDKKTAYGKIKALSNGSCSYIESPTEKTYSNIEYYKEALLNNVKHLGYCFRIAKAYNKLASNQAQSAKEISTKNILAAPTGSSNSQLVEPAENSEFQIVADIVKKRSGMFLTPNKYYLIESRISSIVRKYNFRNTQEVIDKIKNRDEKLIEEVVDAMTINETSFYRDQKLFEEFSSIILPYISSQRPEKTNIKILIAACSTGQEPYSLAIHILENTNLAKYNFDITAVDIAQHVLDKAISGKYTQFEVQRGLPIKQLLKYFVQEGEHWNVDRKLKSMIRFKKCNLISDMIGNFDIIFCRNVLIYFDKETKITTLQNLHKQLEPSGVLAIGFSETMLGIDNKFQPLKDAKSLYIKA
jgi:chemotaxis protein methyltransferase CheR